MTDTPEQPPKKAGLLASTAVVATMTMLSRVLGLVRDVVIARMLGASAGADAFFCGPENSEFPAPVVCRRGL